MAFVSLESIPEFSTEQILPADVSLEWVKLSGKHHLASSQVSQQGSLQHFLCEYLPLSDGFFRSVDESENVQLCVEEWSQLAMDPNRFVGLSVSLTFPSSLSFTLLSIPMANFDSQCHSVVISGRADKTVSGS